MLPSSKLSPSTQKVRNATAPRNCHWAFNSRGELVEYCPDTKTVKPVKGVKVGRRIVKF